MSNELAVSSASNPSSSPNVLVSLNPADMLAHELNSPIGTISNILLGVKIRLEKAEVSIDGIDTALNKALEQVQFSQRIINTIYASKNAHQKNHRVLDVRQQIYSSIALLQTLLSDNRCHLVLQLPKYPVFLRGDATQLQQVMTNLLRNAVEAMPDNQSSQRQIVISVQQCKQRLMLSIADNAQSFQEECGNPFSANASGNTLNKTKNMGIGLAICRSIVEMHNGHLTFSVAEGVGCTCLVDLPAVSSDAIACGDKR